MQQLPGLMKAVMLTGHGGFDRLEFRDVPVPTPAHGEVLIRVGAAAVNNTDINTRTGWYSRAVSEGTTATGAARGLAEAAAEDSGWTGDAPRFPRIQGADACGHIVAVGAGVDPALSRNSRACRRRMPMRSRARSATSSWHHFRAPIRPRRKC